MTKFFCFCTFLALTTFHPDSFAGEDNRSLIEALHSANLERTMNAASALKRLTVAPSESVVDAVLTALDTVTIIPSKPPSSERRRLKTNRTVFNLLRFLTDFIPHNPKVLRKLIELELRFSYWKKELHPREKLLPPADSDDATLPNEVDLSPRLLPLNHSYIRSILTKNPGLFFEVFATNNRTKFLGMITLIRLSEHTSWIYSKYVSSAVLEWENLPLTDVKDLKSLIDELHATIEANDRYSAPIIEARAIAALIREDLVETAKYFDLGNPKSQKTVLMLAKSLVLMGFNDTEVTKSLEKLYEKSKGLVSKGVEDELFFAIQSSMQPIEFHKKYGAKLAGIAKGQIARLSIIPDILDPLFDRRLRNSRRQQLLDDAGSLRTGLVRALGQVSRTERERYLDELTYQGGHKLRQIVVNELLNHNPQLAEETKLFGQSAIKPYVSACAETFVRKKSKK